MSRVGRIVVPGFAHHVTHLPAPEATRQAGRGNRRGDVFETAGDYEAYLGFVK